MATNRKTWQCWLLTIILIVIKWEGANICVRTGWQKLEASWQKFRVCRQKVEGVGVRIVANLLTGLKKNLGGGGGRATVYKNVYFEYIGGKKYVLFFQLYLCTFQIITYCALQTYSLLGYFHKRMIYICTRSHAWRVLDWIVLPHKIAV